MNNTGPVSNLSSVDHTCPAYRGNRIRDRGSSRRFLTKKRMMTVLMLKPALGHLILSLTMPQYCDLSKVLSAPQTVYELKSKEILLW